MVYSDLYMYHSHASVFSSREGEVGQAEPYTLLNGLALSQSLLAPCSIPAFTCYKSYALCGAEQGEDNVTIHQYLGMRLGRGSSGESSESA